jgi:phosphoglycolate phosphatase
VSCDALIFDLDGTLWDAAAASTHGWNLALEQLGVATRVTVDDIRSVSGKPFSECVATLLPELPSAEEATVHLIDEYERLGIETMGGVLYAGVREGLEELSRRRRLFIVSNCPAWYLEAFFRITGLQQRFTDWDCHGASGLHKTEMLRGLAQRHALQRAVYVGDTQGDLHAANGAGMRFAHAAYGFGKTVDPPSLSFASFPELVVEFL